MSVTLYSSNGYAKVRWTWNEMQEVLVKFLHLDFMNKLGYDFTIQQEELMLELDTLLSSEPEEVYLNAAMLELYGELNKQVLRYEALNGEIMC